ncbi:MAG: hypothetical protein FVQ84_21545 [Planctomycetes bacterium]|nr:hypothetical protein [Planctomycetota bacterium]
MNNITIILLGYIGPETMLPLASFLAAGFGIILMFWKYIMRLIRRLFGAVFRRKKKNVDAKTVLPTNPKADGSDLVKSVDPEDGGGTKE